MRTHGDTTVDQANSLSLVAARYFEQAPLNGASTILTLTPLGIVNIAWLSANATFKPKTKYSERTPFMV